MIIFLYGEDSFRSRQKLFALKAKFIKEVDASGNSLFVIPGEKAVLSDIVNSTNTNPLFSRRSMIIVDDIFSNADKNIFTELLKFFKNKNHDSDNDNIVIFWGSAIGKSPTKDKKALWELLAKQKYSEKFTKLSNTELNSWIKSEVEKRGGSITLSLSAEIASILSGDMHRISQEIDKLLNYKEGQSGVMFAGEKIEIVQADIESQITGDFDQNIFNLTEAIAGGNREIAAALLEEQISSGAAFESLMGAVLWQFKKLLEIKQAVEDGINPRNIAKELKIHPFIVQKSLSQVRNYSLFYLKKRMSELMDIYKKSREDRSTADVLMGVFVAKI